MSVIRSIWLRYVYIASTLLDIENIRFVQVFNQFYYLKKDVFCRYKIEITIFSGSNLEQIPDMKCMASLLGLYILVRKVHEYLIDRTSRAHIK